jgi:hypothetical protein
MKGFKFFNGIVRVFAIALSILSIMYDEISSQTGELYPIELPYSLAI